VQKLLPYLVYGNIKHSIKKGHIALVSRGFSLYLCHILDVARDDSKYLKWLWSFKGTYPPLKNPWVGTYPRIYRLIIEVFFLYN
jgi:hypothetical protein